MYHPVGSTCLSVPDHGEVDPNKTKFHLDCLLLGSCFAIWSFLSFSSALLD